MTKRIIDGLVVAAQAEGLKPKDIRLIQGKLIRGLARLNDGKNWVRNDYVKLVGGAPCFCSVGAIAGVKRGLFIAGEVRPQVNMWGVGCIVTKADRKQVQHVKTLRHAFGFLGNVIHRHRWATKHDIYCFKPKHDDTALRAFSTSEGKVTDFNDSGSSYSQVASMFRIAIHELGILADHMEKLA